MLTERQQMMNELYGRGNGSSEKHFKINGKKKI
jgi:hypothetical protein